MSRLPPEIRAIVKDTQASEPYLSHQVYFEAIAQCLVGTVDNQQVGFVGDLFFEAKALEILGHQIEHKIVPRTINPNTIERNMSENLLVVTSSIVILLIILLLVYFLRRNTDISIEEGILVLSKPLGSQRIDLEKELAHWSTQQFRRMLWGGMVYGISMKFKSGKQLTVNSRFDPNTYQQLHQILEAKFTDRKTPAQ